MDKAEIEDGYQETLDSLRKWVRSLGDYNEGSDAQKADIAFHLPAFKTEFSKFGVKFDA